MGPNVIEIMMKTIYTMQHEIAQWRSEIAHVVMEPDMSEFTWMEFHRSDDIAKLGEACAEEALPKIKSLIPFFATSSQIPAQNAPRKNF